MSNASYSKERRIMWPIIIQNVVRSPIFCIVIGLQSAVFLGYILGDTTFVKDGPMLDVLDADRISIGWPFPCVSFSGYSLKGEYGQWWTMEAGRFEYLAQSSAVKIHYHMVALNLLVIALITAMNGFAVHVMLISGWLRFGIRFCLLVLTLLIVYLTREWIPNHTLTEAETGLQFLQINWQDVSFNAASTLTGFFVYCSVASAFYSDRLIEILSAKINGLAVHDNGTSTPESD